MLSLPKQAESLNISSKENEHNNVKLFSQGSGRNCREIKPL